MSITSEGTLIIETGNNVRGLRAIRFDLGFHCGQDGVIRFPDKWDISADLSTIDRVEFFLSHLNLTNVNTSGIEFRMKSGGANYYKVLVDMQTKNWVKHTFLPVDFTTVGSPNWNNINCFEFYIPHSGGVETFYDDFEDGTYDKWTPAGSEHINIITNIEPVSGIYCLSLVDQAIDDFQSATASWTEITSGIVYLDISMQPVSMSGESGGLISIYDVTTDAVAHIEILSNGTVWVVTGDVSPYQNTNYAWTFGKWMHIRIKVNLTASTWDIYIDDYNTPLLTGLSFVDTVTGVQSIRLSTGSIVTGSFNPSKMKVLFDDIYVGQNPISGSFQIDGLVARKREVYAIAENVESQKIWKVRELPLLDKDVIETDTAQVLVDTILRTTQYPTLRVSGTIPLMQDNLLGRNYYIMIKGMKWLLPVSEVRVKLSPKSELLTVTMGRRPPDIQEILDGFGIEQGRISIGGAGADFGAIIEQFEKACFQTCETTCQGCSYGGSCESSCLKTGCLTSCMISLCMTTCQSITDRYNNWCSEGSGCQTCSESPFGII